MLLKRDNCVLFEMDNYISYWRVITVCVIGEG